jgi:hypothetical protein
MITDLNSIFSGSPLGGSWIGQPVTGPTISTNIMDLRAVGGSPAVADDGSGFECFLVVSTVQLFSNVTGLAITLESDNSANLVTAPVVHSRVDVPLASLAANSVIATIRVPPAAYKRYLGVRFTPIGGTPATGSVTAYLTLAVNDSAIYPTRLPIA